MSFPPAKRLAAGLATAALIVTAPVAAQAIGPAPTSITTFAVTATVSTTCFLTANSLNFGPYTSAQLDGTTTLNATCSSATPYNIGLDQGTSSGATINARAMSGPGSQLLSYSLFRDAAHTLNWGNTIGTDTVASTGTGASQSFSVFGRIPAAQFVGAGEYSDTITVTLTF
jgi:spore coat protein U-like protein